MSKTYRKKGVIEAHPYQKGDSLEGVSVSPQDHPNEGGWIANDPNNPSDKWFINSNYFKKNYELA